MLKSFARCLFIFTTFVAIPCLGADSSVAGKYSDGQLTVELADSAGAYSGTFTLGSQQFPVSARSNGQGVDGNFTSNGKNFPFTATLAGDTMTLSSGHKTYSLKRISTSDNPLETAPANPMAQSDPLAGYTVAVTCDSGKSLVTQKPQATSVQAALEATFPDLARYFGARPAIGSAYEDVKDHKSGGATFSANLNGQPVKGIVSCKLNDKGATVAVVYCRADASKADWDKLMPANVPDNSNSAAAPTAALGSDAEVYQFPDGTGSITLAKGWQTQASSAIAPIRITGPNDEHIGMNITYNIQSSDSQLLKMMEHNEAMMRQMGGRPVPRPPMLIAEFTDPVQALTDLIPQLSKLNQANGGPAVTLDKIISQKDAPTSLRGGKAAIICYQTTRTQNGNSAQFQALDLIQIAPIAQGTWMLASNNVGGPAPRFEQDRPMMLAMVNSLHVNQEVANRRMQEMNQQNMAMIRQQGEASQAALTANHEQFMRDQDQRFAQGQAAHAQQMQGYAQHNEQWKADELQKSRNNADFVETIRGTRTVYDTQTGAVGTADLNYVNGVVDSLNTAANDPNRFVQIPLRDEMYPVPPAGK